MGTHVRKLHMPSPQGLDDFKGAKAECFSSARHGKPAHVPKAGQLVPCKLCNVPVYAAEPSAHIWRWHMDDPYAQCPHCAYASHRSVSNVKRHMRRRHKHLDDGSVTVIRLADEQTVVVSALKRLCFEDC